MELSGESKESSQSGLKMAWKSEEWGLAWCFWGVSWCGWGKCPYMHAGAPWFKLPTGDKGATEPSYQLCPDVGKKGKAEWWGSKAVINQTSKIESDSSLQWPRGRKTEWGRKSSRHLYPSLGPLFLQSERKFPSIPQSFRDLQAITIWVVWEIKEKKKGTGKFPPFSLNVGRSFPHCSYQSKRAFAGALCPCQCSLPGFRLPWIQGWGYQGEKSGKRTYWAVLQISIFSPSYLLFSFHSKYLLLVFCPGFIAAFSGRDKLC